MCVNKDVNKKLMKVFKRKHSSYLVSNLSAQDQVMLTDIVLWFGHEWADHVAF